MLSNYLGSDIEISYELLNAIIECWVLIADLLVRNGIKVNHDYFIYIKLIFKGMVKLFRLWTRVMDSFWK